MRADRLLSIMLLLHQKGNLTAEMLAERLEVSVRTIYRDIEALNVAGVPIYTQSGPHGGVFLDSEYQLALTSLSRTELQSLFIEGASRPLSDLGLGNAVENLYLKLLAELPALQRSDAERLRQRVYIDPKGWFQTEEELPFLPLVQQAVWEDEEIEIAYEKAEGESRTRSVQPYALVCKFNTWYLVGKLQNGALRTFRISRLRAVRLTGTRFERDTHFHVKSYWEESSRVFERQFEADYPVLLRIPPERLTYFEWYLPNRYNNLRQPDEHGKLLLKVLFYGLHEARSTVMGLGTSVEVVEPHELVENILSYSLAFIESLRPKN